MKSLVGWHRKRCIFIPLANVTANKSIITLSSAKLKTTTFRIFPKIHFHLFLVPFCQRSGFNPVKPSYIYLKNKQDPYISC